MQRDGLTSLHERRHLVIDKQGGRVVEQSDPAKPESRVTDTIAVPDAASENNRCRVVGTAVASPPGAGRTAQPTSVASKAKAGN
jgi:hypothetical protein